MGRESRLRPSLDGYVFIPFLAPTPQFMVRRTGYPFGHEVALGGRVDWCGPLAVGVEHFLVRSAEVTRASIFSTEFLDARPLSGHDHGCKREVVEKVVVPLFSQLSHCLLD